MLFNSLYEEYFCKNNVKLVSAVFFLFKKAVNHFLVNYMGKKSSNFYFNGPSK